MNQLFRALSVCLLLLETSFMHAQNNISGVITGNDGKPVPFASVQIRATQLSTMADAAGHYELKKVPAGRLVMLVRNFGYIDKLDSLEVQGETQHNVVLVSSPLQLDEVVVDASRVKGNSGMAYNDLDAAAIRKANMGQDAPYVLNNLPNVVVNSDAGNGVGYTGLRIRGSDATRVNVTINGVPVNDAESQGTFWVDMPDLVSSANSIQVQRGVGTSANGAGAFGASINFQTNNLNPKAYGNLISTAGSYGTWRNTIAGGSGLIKNKFSIDARASSIRSNGYIDRASSNLNSLYFAAGYYGKKSVLKFIQFSGWETTYQAWNYVPEDSIRAGNRTYNSCGEYYDDNGRVQYYKNETDNYTQHNSQLHFIYNFNSRVNLNVTAHYTKGMGYYEQFRRTDDWLQYGIAPVVTGVDTVSSGDLVRRLWLDNDFAGGIFNLYVKASSRLAMTLGGGYNTYFGRHYGRIVWTDLHPNLDAQYGMNTANKNDGNIYLKTNWKMSRRLNAFIDLQSRHVAYTFTGLYDAPGTPMQNVSYLFFNPKLGLNYSVGNKTNVYASVARANKEPNRDDFVQSNADSRPKPEQLTDLEGGVRYSAAKFTGSFNLYNMQYNNQLVLNGKINNVGAYNRVNVSSSYRRGVEFEAGMPLTRLFEVGGNLSLSENKILNYSAYDDAYLNEGTTQVITRYKNTDISFSPSAVASAWWMIKPVKGLECTFIYKHVGRQYLDNTSNISRSIRAYDLLDLRMNYTVKTKKSTEITFMLSIYNLGNALYETNGYTYSYYTSTSYNTFNFLAPAAPRNFLGGISIKL